MTRVIRFTVNGEPREVTVPTYRTLLDCLRYDLDLTGSKEGCGVGVCGACTVLLDGKMISSCIALAVFADGREVTTVEGLAADERLHPVQQAFIDFGGFQCGICTPGQVVAAKALLDCLRYDLGLTGSKEGCGVGVCGACTVLLDGKMISSCIALAVFADGREVTTVEGLAEDERLHPVQQAFMDAGGFQ